MEGLQWATGKAGTREFALPAARRRIDWRCDLERPCRWFGSLAEPLIYRTLLVEHEARRLQPHTWWRNLAGWCLAMDEPESCHRPALLVLTPGLGRRAVPETLALKAWVEPGVWCLPEVEPAVWFVAADQLDPNGTLGFLGVLATAHPDRLQEALAALMQNHHFSIVERQTLMEATVTGQISLIDPERFPGLAGLLQQHEDKGREEGRMEALRLLDPGRAQGLAAIDDPARRDRAVREALQELRLQQER
jgi:hypothetical protein